MSSETISNNFIKNIIVDDLEIGKHDHIITRFWILTYRTC